jgi:hypothetical protein
LSVEEERMRLLLLVAVTVSALAVAPLGTSAPPGTIEAFGSGTPVVSFNTTFTPTGTNMLKFTGSTVWELLGAPFGALDGDSAASIAGTLNCETGEVHGNGTETYIGPIPHDFDHIVTLTWRYHFSGTGECETPDLTTLEGKGILVEATGDVVPGTHGTIEFTDFLGGGFGSRKYFLTYF